MRKSMQCLLRESEFANIYMQELDGFIIEEATPKNEAIIGIKHYFYSHKNKIGIYLNIAEIKIKNNKLLSLEIKNNNADLIVKFIKLYCVEPYTYTYLILRTEAFCNPMIDSKTIIYPYAYSGHDIIHKSNLPKCIHSSRYTKSYLGNEKNSKFEYNFIRRLIDKLPASNRYLTTKSARNAINEY